MNYTVWQTDSRTLTSNWNSQNNQISDNINDTKYIKQSASYLLSYGSYFGDGSERGVDYTADSLHQMAVAMNK